MKGSVAMMEKKICVYCGFGIPGILEKAHINKNGKDNDPDNIAYLCPTCHRMLDTGLIASETIKERRNHTNIPDWSILIGLTPEQLSARANKAHETINKNKDAQHLKTQVD
jgi:heterodisulfide reductase subunit B